MYGYCDATYQEGWGRDQTVDFVKNSSCRAILSGLSSTSLINNIALALAMSRDGSSGGVVRMCVITEDGVERLFVPGNELPKFWEGREVLGAPASTKEVDMGIVPMAIEA